MSPPSGRSPAAPAPSSAFCIRSASVPSPPNPPDDPSSATCPFVVATSSSPRNEPEAGGTNGGDDAPDSRRGPGRRRPSGDPRDAEEADTVLPEHGVPSGRAIEDPGTIAESIPSPPPPSDASRRPADPPPEGADDPAVKPFGGGGGGRHREGHLPHRLVTRRRAPLSREKGPGAGVSSRRGDGDVRELFGKETGTGGRAGFPSPVEIQARMFLFGERQEGKRPRTRGD